MTPSRQHRARRRAAWVGLGLLALLAAGCAHPPPKPAARAPLFFPPPPEPARVQYLGAVSSQADLPRPQSRFADLVLGAPPAQFPLVKPISAVLSGTRLYVADTVLNAILVYDLATGEAHRLAGDTGNGKIQQPNAIVRAPDGRLLVCDKQRGAVLVYGADESFVAAWGRPGEAQPVAVACGPGVLYVCDIKDHEIEVWDAANGNVLRKFGGQGVGAGQLFLPTQVAVDAQGQVWVTDTGNFRVQAFTPEGKVVRQIGKLGNALGQFAWPKGMDLDAEGTLYVADARFANVQMFDAQGRLLLFFGGPGPERGNLELPAGLRVQPWPAGVAWLEERVAPGFRPRALVTVVSQQGPGLVNFYAVAAGAAPAAGSAP